jgi:HEAT repeat protein
LGVIAVDLPGDTEPEREPSVEELLSALAAADCTEQRVALRVVIDSSRWDQRLIGAVVELLRSPDWEVREEAVVVLTRMGQSAVPALVAALASDDIDFRKAAVIALAHLGPAARAAAPALTALCADEQLDSWPNDALVCILHSGWHHRVLRSWWFPWVTGGLALALALSAVVLILLGILNSLPRSALIAGIILGGVGAWLGLIIGSQVGGIRRATVLVAMYAVGGASAGFLLGWLFSNMLSPVIDTLSR